MVAVDATFLPYLLGCKTNEPNDPATNQPIEELQERVEFLIETLGEEGETIVVPTPALCEFLVLAKDDGPEYQAKIAKDPLFIVKPFDERAAVELAMIYIEADAKKGRKALKRQTQEQTWARMKFDRQILAISRVHQAHTIYTEDKGVANFAATLRIKAVSVWDLPKPPVAQKKLPFAEDEKTATVTTSQAPLPAVRPDTVVRIDKPSSIKMETKSDE